LVSEKANPTSKGEHPMRGKVRNVPHKRRYLGLAILALAVAAAAALTSGSVSVPFASAASPDTCGYAGGSTTVPVTNRSLVKFNEIGIIEGFSVTTPANPQTVNTFYSDEHALTIGATGTPWVATYNDPPTTIKRIDDAGTNPANVGGGPARTSPLATGAAATDPFGREVAPSLYLTDVSTDATLKTGDWQSQPAASANTTAQRPTYVGGTWKDNGAANPLGSDGKEAKNGADLGPHSEAFVNNISTSQGIEGYGAEVRWDVSSLTNGGQALKPGHTYRVQMMFHDGDHNADTGEACTTFKIPPKSPSGTTTASGGGQLTKDATGALSVSTTDSATLSGGTRNAAPDASSTNSGKVIFRLYQVNDQGTGSVDCGLDANGDPVNADAVTGSTRTVLGTNGTAAQNSGGADFVNVAGQNNRGKYNTTASPVKLTIPGTYYWTVEYTGNIENNAFSETACGDPAEQVVVTKAPSQVVTTPSIKLTEDINITLSASANAGIQVGDTVDVSLLKEGGGPADGCASKGVSSVTGATQQGSTKTITLDATNYNSSTGVVNITLKYPDDFTPGAPAIGNGSYHWFVQYNGNTQVTGSNDDCQEFFTISGL